METVIQKGVPRDAAQIAFAKFADFQSQVRNVNFMAIIDFTQHSGQKRFYMIDRNTGNVEAMTVAHGTASDPDKDGYAQYFSNVPNSKMSSLGSYLVAERYVGKHGASLRLDGLEETNLNVRNRAIVLHSAGYVRDDKAKQGWSWGCPALPQARMDRVIAQLQGGAFMYAYGINTYRETAQDELVKMQSTQPGYRWVNESDDAPEDGEL